MYTLRRISGDGVEMNKAIGDGYTVTREENTDEFNRFMESYGDKLNTKGFIYCFVTGDDGKYVQPLYKNQQAYIVSENGKTVSNLTHVDLKHEIKWGKIKQENKPLTVADEPPFKVKTSLADAIVFMLEQLKDYSDDHVFPVSDIKRLISLAYKGDAEWVPIEFGHNEKE